MRLAPRLVWLPLIALLGATACSAWKPLRVPSFRAPSPAPIPHADGAAPALPGLEALEGLEISFTDPTTFQTYRASGPFEVVASGPDGLVIEGFDQSFRTTEMRLFLRDGALWVLAQIDGREFLTRLQ